MENSKTSSTYMVHRTMAVVLDVLVVIAFVLIGGRNHHSDFRFSDVVIIGLPFIAAFFALMLIVSTDLRNIKSAFIASIISVPIAILIRINLPQLVGREPYSFKPVFAIISFVFLTICWVGWRFLLNKFRPPVKG
ncbi:MAG: DUF3054 domain-containing protein [Acidimicrobiia bacterium]